MNNGTKVHKVNLKKSHRIDDLAEKAKVLIEDKGEMTKKKLKHAVDMAHGGLRKHWKTAAVIFGAGLLTRLFMGKRKD